MSIQGIDLGSGTNESLYFPIPTTCDYLSFKLDNDIMFFSFLFFLGKMDINTMFQNERNEKITEKIKLFPLNCLVGMRDEM